MSSFVIGVLLIAAPANAWSSNGHQIVCNIAWNETTDAGRAFAQQLLKVSDARGFAGTCTWADGVRDTAGYSWSKPHHYLEPPRGEILDMQNHCPDEGCAPRAIGQQARIVVDVNEPARRRAEALMFVAHFVGDLHQPLHVGYSDDAGGNGIGVTFCPQGCLGSVDTLHKVWDSGIITLSGSQTKLIDGLQTSLTDSERNEWKDDPVNTWANETHALAEDYAYHQVKNGTIKSGYIGDLAAPVPIGDGYLPIMKPIVKQQLKRAAVRLAAALAALAQGTVPPTLTAVAPRFIEPSSHVASSITVRAAADSGSKSIAQLRVGQRAELLGVEHLWKNPKFLRVRLQDGQQGYVPKKKSHVVPE